MKIIKILKNNYRIIFNDLDEFKYSFDENYNFINKRQEEIKRIYKAFENSDRFGMFYEYIRSGFNSTEFTEIYGIKTGTFNGKWNEVNKIGDVYFYYNDKDILNILMYQRTINEDTLNKISESIENIRKALINENKSNLNEYLRINLDIEQYKSSDEDEAKQGFNEALDLIKRNSRASVINDLKMMESSHIRKAINYFNFLITSEEEELSTKRKEEKEKVEMVLGIKKQKKTDIVAKESKNNDVEFEELLI